MKKLTWAAGLTLALLGGASQADLQAGLGAMGRSDYAMALAELRPLADRGNAEAQFNLGQMYTYGWGVKKDLTQATQWYREAADRGHDRARVMLVNLCEQGLNAEENRPDAQKWKVMKPAELVRDGRSLCAKAAKALEAHLEKTPSDLPSRERLLGYYYFGGLAELGAAPTVEARRRHILWLIGNQPAAEVTAFAEAVLVPEGHPLADPQGYAQGSRLWAEQMGKAAAPVEIFMRAANYHQLADKATAEAALLQGRTRHPAAVAAIDAQLGYVYALAVLGVSRLNPNGIPVAASAQEASGTFAMRARQTLEQSDSAPLTGIAGRILSQYGTMLMAFGQSRTGEAALAERLLMRAAQLEPKNPAWPDALGQHLRMLAQRAAAPAQRQEILRRALGYLEKSLAHTADPDWHRSRLVEVAKLAANVGDTARAEKYARELVALAERHPGEAAYGPAWHDGHMVLGRVALMRKAVPEARAHLLKAGQAAGGGTLTSFGPNMRLASELLDLGEKRVVLEYLQLCKVFWNGPHTPVDRWIQDIEAGRKPAFGANLEY